MLATGLGPPSRHLWQTLLQPHTQCFRRRPPEPQLQTHSPRPMSASPPVGELRRLAQRAQQGRQPQEDRSDGDGVKQQEQNGPH